MRLTTYLQKLDYLASADLLCTPIAGVCRSSDRVEDVQNKELPFADKGYERVVIVIDDERPIGYFDDAFLINCVLSGSEQETTIAEGIKHITPGQVVQPSATFTKLLGSFESTKSDILFVGDPKAIRGSITVAELLKPPGLFFLLCMSLELEGAALELCSRYPKSFYKLKKERQEKAQDEYKKNKTERITAAAEFEAESGLTAGEDARCRELLLATMMCDKKEMLTKADLGLRTPAKQIGKVFKFFERVRNYVAHPSASFTWDQDEVIGIANANHERLEDEAECSINIAVSVSEQLSLRVLDLATNVRECSELIADIDQAQRPTN